MSYQTFSDQEMESRNNKLRQVMDDVNVEAVIGTADEIVTHL